MLLLRVPYRCTTQPCQRARRRVYKTNLYRDFTVKLDVTELQPATRYYYKFGYKGLESDVGTFVTFPDKGAKKMRFGVVSCSNWGKHLAPGLAQLE